MSTKAQITLKISKLSSSAIEKNIADNKYEGEELEIANEVIAKRSASKGKAEAEKAKGTGKKAKPGKAPVKEEVTTDVDNAETPAEVAPKKEKKVKTGKIDAADATPAEKPAKKEKAVKVAKPRKDGHGNIRAAIKEQLLTFASPAEVRKSVKESLKLTREVHYSEVKSVLDNLKKDETFATAWEIKYAAAKAEKAAAKADAAPKEKVAKKKKDTVEAAEPAEPTAEELAALAATEAENDEVAPEVSDVKEAA